MAGTRKGTAWRTSAGAGGQVVVQQVTSDGVEHPPLLVRVQPDGNGRLKIVELYLGGGAPITAEQLHAVRLGAVEELLNQPHLRDGDFGILDRLAEEPRVDTSQARKWFREAARTAKVSRALSAVEKHYGRRPRLQKPESRVYPDSFYAEVAEAVRHAQFRGVPPTPTIAEEAEVPVSTATRWIREARARGHLHPGQRSVTTKG